MSLTIMYMSFFICIHFCYLYFWEIVCITSWLLVFCKSLSCIFLLLQLVPFSDSRAAAKLTDIRKHTIYCALHKRELAHCSFYKTDEVCMRSLYFLITHCVHVCVIEFVCLLCMLCMCLCVCVCACVHACVVHSHYVVECP